ncbi:rRNA-processing protein EFG1 [Gracilariopsis chorda]|uniref:rRNA-processing protein EFG1 n=1 Tax=Gracilariopsis chorda TaxID=448386 RepID=A0A2V3IY91_9FLOR|nr:rRNA-processing protein EFG1 [Gracilariopsis chorda]|eukprot:PXF47033.1 rRNA-processing protein EFG1 [Gracilariopsis chorda]
MAAHIRFDVDEEAESKEVPSGPVSTAVPTKAMAAKPQSEVAVTNGIHKKAQTKLSSQSKRKSRLQLPAYQVRSLERYLNKMGHQLPPAALKQKKQELEEWKRVAAERKRRTREQKFESRYKQVKFFEARKVRRLLESIAKKGNRSEDEQAKLQAEKDLRYIESYPKDKKYIALFPSRGHTEESRRKVEQMRAFIEGSNDAVEKDTSPRSPSVLQDEDDFFLNCDEQK